MNWRNQLLTALTAILFWLLSGCAGAELTGASSERRFRFESDSLAFANELVWSYGFDGEKTWRATKQLPEPDYTHRCFVLVRSARQFFEYARFEPELPQLPEPELRERVRRVVGTNPRRRLPDSERIAIPGFANLRQLSRAHEALLKEELGGAVWSYIERGNWRMVIPLSRRHQAATAERLVAALAANRPPIIHLIRFPHIRINHALMLYDYQRSAGAIRFTAYDPNAPDAPAHVHFDPTTRTFTFDRNTYFDGGRVDVYEIYHHPWY